MLEKLKSNEQNIRNKFLATGQQAVEGSDP